MNATQAQTLHVTGIVEIQRTCERNVTNGASLNLYWMPSNLVQQTMETEYIAISQAMCSVIPLIQLMDELNKMMPFYNPTPEVR